MATHASGDNLVDLARKLLINQSETPVVEPGSLPTSSVETLADLRILGTPDFDFEDGTAISTLGYTTAGDGGHGDYRWDAASVLADNGGSVILPAGHVGAGRWRLVHDGSVNVKQFGATGDGSTDDSAPIQAAVDTGLSVSLPAGDFRIESTITVSTSGQKITGADMYGTIIRSSGMSGGAEMVSVVGAQRLLGIHISDMTLHGNEENVTILSCSVLSLCHFERLDIRRSSGRGLKLVNVWDSLIADSWIRNCGDAGTTTEATWFTTDDDDGCNRLIMARVTWEGNYYRHVRVQKTGTPPRDNALLVFRDCKFHGNTALAIGLLHTVSELLLDASNCDIESCYFYYSNSNFIEVTGTRNRIAGCFFFNSQQPSVSFASGASSNVLIGNKYSSSAMPVFAAIADANGVMDPLSTGVQARFDGNQFIFSDGGRFALGANVVRVGASKYQPNGSNPSYSATLAQSDTDGFAVARAAAGGSNGAVITPSNLFRINSSEARSYVPFGIPTATPASAGATGTTGLVAWDASYIYVCTATNTWKRAAIATW